MLRDVNQRSVGNALKSHQGQTGDMGAAAHEQINVSIGGEIPTIQLQAQRSELGHATRDKPHGFTVQKDVHRAKSFQLYRC